MLGKIIIWGALAPAAISAVILLLAWRRPAETSDEARAPWAAALAIGLAYVVGSWGISEGAQGDPNARLLWIALLGLVVGLVESSGALPRWASWLVRLSVSAAAAWVLVDPLVGPQQWSFAQAASRVGAIAGAAVLIWSTLDGQGAREQGPSLVMALALVAAGGSAAVLFSGLASTAQAEGVLIAGLGAAFLVAWRYPAPARLRSAAPVVSLLLVGHAATGLLYADLPPLSFALLSLTPLALLLSRLGAMRRVTAAVALAVRLAAVAAPLGAAVATAAIPYFDLGGEPAASSSSSSGGNSADTTKAKPASSNEYDEDYGY